MNEYDLDKYDSNLDDLIFMVFVFLVGGGMFVVYWIVMVFGYLVDELFEDFVCYFFLFSGVSGGFVGLVIFYSLFFFDSEVVMDYCFVELCVYESMLIFQEKFDSYSYVFCGYFILCMDFLGFVIVGLLYQDLLLQFFFVDLEMI